MHIDLWTLTLQTVNVLILIWLVSRFLYRPVTALIDRRHQEAQKILADAAAFRSEAEQARAAAEETRAGLLAERERLILEAHEAARAEGAAVLAHAAGSADQLRADAEAAIARERLAAEGALINHARELAVEIARRLLARLAPEETMRAFLDGLCRQVGALPSHLRAPFASSEPGAQPIEVVTAMPLTADAADRVRRTLEAALGSEHTFIFRADPAVIAGIELHSRHAVVCNSFRADLDRISEELKREDKGADRLADLARAGEADR